MVMKSQVGLCIKDLFVTSLDGHGVLLLQSGKTYEFTSQGDMLYVSTPSGVVAFESSDFISSHVKWHNVVTATDRAFYIEEVGLYS